VPDDLVAIAAAALRSVAREIELSSLEEKMTTVQYRRSSERITNQSTCHTGRASLIGRTLTFVLLSNIIGSSSVAHAQTPYTFTKIADTAQNPDAHIDGIYCIGLSNNGTVVVSAVGLLWRGDGQSFTQVSANNDSLCPSINDLDEIAYITHTPPPTVPNDLVRNSNGTLTILAQSDSSPSLNTGTTYLPSLSHSGSAVYQASDGIYIGPGGVKVINGTSDPQLSNYSTASMNDSLIVAFRAFNSSSSKWGVYRGSATPLFEDGGSVITNVGLNRPVINNSGTIAFFGRDVSNNVGVFKTDDGVNFTFVGIGGSQAGHDRISINNAGVVAFDGALAAGSNEALFVGSAYPPSPVISVGDGLDGSTVQALFMWEESLNDNGQLAFWAFLANGREGVYRANPNHPPVASNGTASVTAGQSVSGTLNVTDQEGDTLAYSIVTNGTKGTAVITNVSIGAYTYTANVGSSGTDTFTFKANDGFADSNTGTVTVTITPAGACATDITATVAVSGQGPLKLNKKTGRYTSTVTLKNGDGAVSGPISLVLDNLSSNATLFNLTGTTACAAPSGSPYVNVDVGADTVFSPRERATVTLEFANPSGQSVTYTPRALAGSGGR